MSTVKQEAFTIQDFKNLLVNRAEIEKILGITINPPIDTEKQYLKDYSMFEYINLVDVIAIFLGLNPNNCKARNNHPRYWTIYKAIETAVRNGTLITKVEQDFDINGNEIQYDIYLSHESAKQWAETYDLEWSVEPYKGIKQNSITSYPQLDYVRNETTENQDHHIAELQAQIEELQKQITELEKENEQLKNGELLKNVVDYSDCSIYRHKSENLELLFKFAKRISEQCDIGDLHSYPEKDHYAEYFEKYLTKNTSLAEAFYKILTPENVKNKGRKPEGVDTFQGFI